MNVLCDILLAVDPGYLVALMLLDLSDAFDNIDHVCGQDSFKALPFGVPHE